MERGAILLIEKSLFKSLFRYFQIFIFLCSAAGFIVGQVISNNDWLLLSLGLLFLANLCYGLEKMRERFVFFLFNCACVFFLYGRIVIKYLTKNNWQGVFTYDVNRTALTIIYLSVMFLLFGAVLYSNLYKKEKRCQNTGNHFLKNQSFWRTDEFRKNVQIVSFIVYLLCAVCLLISEIEKPIALRGKSYVDYYAAFESSLPGFVLSISALAKFVLCIFLATLPSKGLAFIALGIYVVSAIPVFIVGQRNKFISVALFVVCYYLLRDYIRKDGEKRWFGKFEISAVVIALPFLFAFLSIYESIRKDIAVSEINILQSISNLFYSQGVTYEVICKCISHIAELPSTNFNYTFGSLINYLKGNSFGTFLGFESYKSQTIESALYGNSLGDTISYIDLGSKYFEGAGLGSSYIVENYIDFGYIGVIILSFLLGMFLIWLVKNFNKNIFASYVVLVSLLQLFMLPRSSASGWLVLIIYIPAIFFVGILLFASYLCQKEYYK